MCAELSIAIGLAYPCETHLAFSKVIAYGTMDYLVAVQSNAATEALCRLSKADATSQDGTRP